MTRRAPPSRRRSWIALLALGVVAALLVILLTDDGEEEGLTVHVTIVDTQGAPVRKARAQARYTPGWQRADAAGTVVLRNVRLRVGEKPSAESLAEALDAEGPHHALRRGRTPVATRRDDGDWAVRFTLEAHGWIRLTIAAGPFTRARAWVVRDDAGGHVEAVSGIEVARPGQRASWRIYPGVDEVEVRIAGDAGQAARRFREKAPSVGFAREITLVPERADPITGRVDLPTDPPPPGVGGRVRVWEQLEDGGEIEYDPVLVDGDGTFEVPYTGPGRYMLYAQLDFYAVVPPVEVDAGASVVLPGAEPLAWVQIDDAAGWEPRTHAEFYVGHWSDKATWQRTERVVWRDDHILVALPARFSRLRVTVPGTEETVPREAMVEIEDPQPGPNRISLFPIELSHGRVVVHLGDAAVLGARVELTEPSTRAVSVLPGARASATFENVRAGPCRIRVLPRDPSLPPEDLEGDVRTGETLTFDIGDP